MRSILLALLFAFPASALADEPTHGAPSAADLLAQARDGAVEAKTDAAEPAEKPSEKAPKAALAAATDAAQAPTTNKAPQAPAPAEEAPNPFGAAAVLFLGAGVVALGAWGLQKWKLGRDGFDARTMTHVQSMRLGPKHQVSVVDVQGRRFLIGLADGAITLLSEVDAAEAAPKSTPARAVGDDPVRAAANMPESTMTWSSVFDEAREKLDAVAGTDGRVVPFSAETGGEQKVDAYRKAAKARTGRGNAPRARESDSVVVALEQLEKQGDAS
jgi:flagellar biogenesis protein FliO